MKKIKALIADDHRMFADGIISILAETDNIEVIGEAVNGKDAVALAKNLNPDIILMDVNMPELNGIEATRQIKKAVPNVKILMITMHNTREYIQQILSTGAEGYILKNTGRDELLNAIMTIMSGEMFYSAEVTDLVMKSYKEPMIEEKEEVKLSTRELEILKLISQEMTTAEIADTLFISHFTVDTHRKNLLNKLNVRNIAGLVKYAIKQGILE